MGLECAAYPFKIDLRIFTPKTLEAADRKRKALRRKIKQERESSPSLESTTSEEAIVCSDVEAESTRRRRSSASWTMEHRSIEKHDDGDETVPGQMILTPHVLSFRLPIKTEPFAPSLRKASSSSVECQSRSDLHCSPRPQSPLECLDSRFISNFLSSVSSLLIVYDNSHNANPYRLAFPRMASESIPLQEAMIALGALHLSNTQPWNTSDDYKSIAISRYSSSVLNLRQELTEETPPRLADLATVLLLIFFEVMDSQMENWHTHLRGAKNIFERLFAVSIPQQQRRTMVCKHDEALRSFLISTLAYLDVAAAASCAGPTEIKGPYWDRVGGGWQYNLGVPSLNALLSGRVLEDECLAGIRKSWSKLMHIQSDVGQLSDDIRHGLDSMGQKASRENLSARLEHWHRTLPPIFAHTEDKGGLLYDAECLEGASCIISYEQAIIVYLHQVLGTDRSTLELEKNMDIIVKTFRKYGRGVSQMGMLWALFIVGTETTSVHRQEYIRLKLQGMLSFGMGNIKRTLDLLDIIWQRRRNACGEVRWFVVLRELQWSLLIP